MAQGMDMRENKKIQIELCRNGSALIMTIVLTVLLASIAVMFVAVARMDRASTSNIADNKTLDLSAQSIIEIINTQLIKDTPGVTSDANTYYDYPDANNLWLANIEPYYDGTDYRWHQISDVTGYLKNHNFAIRNIEVAPTGLSTSVVREYPEFELDSNGEFEDGGVSADADGDGIADSKWIVLDDLRSSTGKPILAAVRIIDNGGMININTAYTFSPDGNASEIDGHTYCQMQVNLDGLLKKTDEISDLHNARCSGRLDDRESYWHNFILSDQDISDSNYSPFDISDELELRYRYCIDSKFVSRFETVDPCTPRGAGTRNFGNLYDSSTDWGLPDWEPQITEPNNTYADRRHMLTTYNYDRIIAPDGNMLTNINDANKTSLYNVFRKFCGDVNAAQIAVNIWDYRDSDSDVNYFDKNGTRYYGFESPCVYISEIAYRQKTISGERHKSYAIELYKPYKTDENPDSNNWHLYIGTKSFNINWGSSDSNQYYVLRCQDSNVPLDVNGTVTVQDMNSSFAFENLKISLVRKAEDGNERVVDRKTPIVYAADGNYYFQRDIARHKCIKSLWSGSGVQMLTKTTLGAYNTGYSSTDPNVIQAHPANNDFNNVGQIGNVFRKAASYSFNNLLSAVGTIGYTSDANKESQVRLNLADANCQKMFNYLTTLDPKFVGLNKIKGRININTAPAFVIAQLPWVSLRKNDYNEPNLSEAIIAYRDKLSISSNGGNYTNRRDPCGFASIGQLCNVTRGADPNFSIAYYSKVKGDLETYPDLTYGDSAADDFEERDVIFARISDLVTVRSDVFTAYILVRVGTDGPQKRYIAILDRSKTTAGNKKVRIKAFQYVPEAR